MPVASRHVPTTQADLEAQAGAAIHRALRSLGHSTAEASRDAGWDLIATVDGREIPISIKAASVITPASVARMFAVTDKRRKSVAHVAVGDLITRPARQALRDAGWGWLDRRGHLVLRTECVHIDADVPADLRPSTGSTPRRISGAAAISWAAGLLLAPGSPPSMREVARRVSLSHSAIVAASKRLKAASLIRADGRPLVPELFWALAEEWHPHAIALARMPPFDDGGTYGALGVNLEGDEAGWAVAGTAGAVAWGAPVVLGSSYPPDFYVPSAVELRQATLRLGEAPRYEDRACTVAVAPTPLVCARRFDRAGSEWGPWRFAHGLFAALDLAQDQTRGAEILEDWKPKDFTRVW